MSIRSRIGELALKIYKRCRRPEREAIQDECLHALTPTLLSDEEYKPYEKEFSFIFSNPKLRNIALMGSYGAGKSTVIETWNERQQQSGEGHVCTFISLAHFHGSNDDANAIEGEILNQLIHQTDPKCIPKSRFRHTKDNHRSWDFLKAAACVGYGALTAFLIALFLRDGIVLSDSLTPTHPWLLSIWLLGLVLVLYWAFREDKADRFLRRIKFFGNEVELFEYSKEQSGEDNSELRDPIFNKYMDDVLYLLNNSGSDVLIFEDIDRFDDSIEIFEKLRELNSLANACRSNKLETLRFFFLVREDLFEAPEDRVKFFDFIIPVIPFADSDGNYFELKKGLNKQRLGVSDLFAYEISSFVPDSRTLKEIINETKHYKEHVFRGIANPLTEDEVERLVAIVVYKVVFPTDFSNFQRGKGYVAEFLKKRDKIIEAKREALDEERSTLEEEIREIEEKNHFTLEELALISCGDLSIFDRFMNYPDSPITSKENTKEMIKAIRKYEKASNKLDEEMSRYLKDEENQKRFGIPGDNLESRKRGCLARIQEIDEATGRLNCYTLGELLMSFENDDQFNLEAEQLDRPADYEDCQIAAVQQSQHFPLLKHLLSTDLIDDSSIRYVIRVRPEGLSLADQRNLAIITGRRPIDPAYVFDKPSDALMRIRDEYLMVPGSQNYSILKEILLQDETRKLECFVIGLRRGEHAAFFLDYVLSKQFVPDVFHVLEKGFDSEVALILSDETVPVERRRDFAHTLICHEGSWELEDTEKALLEFASSDSGFLSVDEDLLEGTRSNINHFQLDLRDIEFKSADDELLDIVYENNLYEPNAILAAKWVNKRFPAHMANGQSVAASVFSLPSEKLNQFVESNMDIFVSSLLQPDDASLSESEDVLIWVLNAMSDDEQLASLFASRLGGCAVQNLDRVERTMHKRALLKHNRVIFSAKNLLDYFAECDNEIDNTLSAYIRDHLDSEQYSQGDMQRDIAFLSNNEAFIRSAIQDSELTDENVNVLMSGSNSVLLVDFDIENLSSPRVDVVFRTGRIPVTVENLLFTRENYPDCEPALAVSDIDAYLALFFSEDEEIDFYETDGLELLASNDVSPTKKVEIAGLFESDIQLNSAYPDALKIEIINNHFDSDDLPLLSREYESGSKQLREAIKNRVVAGINDFISQSLSMSRELLCAVLKDPRMSNDSKLEFVAFQLDLNDSSIDDRASVRNCFEAAGFEEYVKLVDGKKISVLDDDVNNKIVNILAKRGMSSDKGVEKGANGRMTVYPKGYHLHSS